MNISEIHDCYGCGVCAVVCPRNIIQIKLNKDGFYEPSIQNPKICTNCGLCIEVCSYSHKDIALNNTKINCFAGWSKDEKIRKLSSSGGISFELGKMLINQGYKICGVKYNNIKNRAEHYIATNLEELSLSIGSKYMQSYTLNAFTSINRKEKYLVIGTPCQIDSFRRYIKKFRCENNFILMDFFCHGVPSIYLWEKYIKNINNLTGNILYASWRNKIKNYKELIDYINNNQHPNNEINWHDSYNIIIKGTKGNYASNISDGDMFYKFFLNDLCLGKACYEHCRFKQTNSSADIRIGDAWGHYYENDVNGVNAIITFTDIGANLINNCDCQIVKQSIEVITEFQMKDNPVLHTERNEIIYALKKNLSWKNIFLIIKISRKFKQIKDKISKLYIC